MFSELIGRYWWMLLLRGIAAVLFGFAAFIWPGLTLITLVLLFGAYALIDGIFAIIAAIKGRERIEHWWVLLLEGIAGVIVGAITFATPGISAVVLLIYIAARAIIAGLFEIIAAVRLRKEIRGEWFLALAGVASIVFGLVLIARPAAGALAVIWIIGTYAIVIGVLLMALAFKARGFARTLAAAR
jgi:uncharacterized membrane protein HdeD (DUF308 family)